MTSRCTCSQSSGSSSLPRLGARSCRRVPATFTALHTATAHNKICCHSFSPINDVLSKITDRSYTSPHVWNQLPDSFRQPHHSCLDSPPHPLVNPSLSSSPLSSSITPSLFHSRIKPTFSTNPSHRRFLLPTGLPHDNGTGPDHAHHFIFSFTFYFLFIPCGRLSWLPVSFLLHVKYTLSYRIVSCPTLSAPAPAPDKAVQRRPNVSSRWATPAQSRLKPTQGGSSGTEGKKSCIKKN